ncbi:MAG: VanZ family protein [Actinomycetota bacterium]
MRGLPGKSRRLPASARIRVGAWLVVVAAVGAVLFLTLGPDLVSGLGAGLIDRTAHAAAYAALTMAVLLSLQPVLGRRPGTGLATAAVAVICAFGGVMEVLQKMSHRDGDVWDAVANTIGAVAVLLFWLILRFWFERRYRRGSSGGRADQKSAAAATDSSSVTGLATGRPTPT